MDKNSVIGFVLMGLILVGFSWYQSGQARKQAVYQAQQDSIALAQYRAAHPYDSLAAPASASASVAEQQTAKAIYKDSALTLAHDAQESIVALENDRIKVEFTTRGAQPYSVRIKDYRNYDSTDLYIFRPGGATYSVSVYTGEYIATKDFTFELGELTDSSVVMRLPFAAGGYIEHRYTLGRDSYAVKDELSFVGLQNVIPRNVGMFDLDFDVVIPRMERGYKNESLYSKLDYYFDGDKKPEAIGRGRNSRARADSRLSWFAFQQQFFSAILRAPGEFASGELGISFYGQDDESRNLMACSARMRADLAHAETVTVPFEFYFGPNSYRTLKACGHKFEKIIPLGGWLVGWFTKYVIIPMFDFLSRFISSFGLVILLMTIAIKTAVFPLTYKSYASSAKMAALKPEMQQINAKYPNADKDQTQMMKKQQATMALYKQAGVSPLGGCLPNLLTFPILWAMFKFFPVSIELRQQSFLWCEDLSAYDSIVDFGFRIPLLGDHLSLFALLMAVTMWGYSKIMMKSQPTADGPSAASMKFMSVWMMPIMMFFICNGLSAALSYYYLLSQLIAMAQIWIVRKCIKPEKVRARLELARSQPAKKSKWQQRLEEAQKLQEKQLREQQRRRR